VKVGPWTIGTTLVVAGALIAYLEVGLAARALTRCDADSAGTGFALSFSFLALTSVHTLLVVTAVGVLATSRRKRVKTTLVGLLVIVVLLAWGYFAFAGLPLANDRCPWGEPTWWPGWLPPAAKTYP
jgi:hypothetical protein